ncbi:MAG: hypothetical protein KGL39_51195 [Patescibacteria group bacterium]|nr:hypothetical protein [Patescibacteria group bacterium]
MDTPTRSLPLQSEEGEKMDPAMMAKFGIKTFDMLPASIQQMMVDYKNSPEKFRKPN